MHPQRRQRLLVIVFIVVCSTAAAGLLFYALDKNTNYYFTPTAIIQGEAPLNKTIRAGGCVVNGSIERSTNSLQVQFLVSDGANNLAVSFDGILPDLFAEGQAAIAKGILNEQGVLEAVEVLAKHDENYTPPEVADGMQDGSQCTGGDRP